MKKNYKQIGPIIIIFIIGVIILLYPFLSNWYNTNKFVTEAKVYEEEVSFIDKEELDKQWKKVKDYNNSLKGEVINDPFVVGSGKALPSNYLEVLNSNAIMGVIKIPAIDVSLPIYHGTGEEQLKKGVGHLEGTFLPVGTNGGHAILTGHTGLPDAKLFTDLIELEIGNEFYIKVLDKELIYQVDDIRVITPEQFTNMNLNSDGDYVTLVTCTPYGVNSHRLLVRGKRIYTMSKSVPIISDNRFLWKVFFILSILSMIGAIVAWLLYNRKNRNEGEQ